MMDLARGMSEKTDIVERLLDQSWDRDGAWNAVSRKLTECLEAADEITRLRSDLKQGDVRHTRPFRPQESKG